VSKQHLTVLMYNLLNMNLPREMTEQGGRLLLATAWDTASV